MSSAGSNFVALSVARGLKVYVFGIVCCTSMLCNLHLIVISKMNRSIFHQVKNQNEGQVMYILGVQYTTKYHTM